MAFSVPDPVDVSFRSPSAGRVTFDEMFRLIRAYVEEGMEAGFGEYNLIIGTDSCPGDETSFVSAVVIHRVGHGGRYFYTRHRGERIRNMRQRLFYETARSLELASLVSARLSDDGLDGLAVEIHLDVGTGGESRDIIREVVGMVTGSGFAARTKPDSYGASKVADRHSRSEGGAAGGVQTGKGAAR
ncbi:MAG TPA: hypothetical protein ENJ37_10835 [Deltaproteobacteria bacterium]|nr:hypothetical protein [Deltaproteobacteria bacterium]